MMTILKGLPLSYFKDIQNDKKIVFEPYDNLSDSIKSIKRCSKISQLIKINVRTCK